MVCIFQAHNELVEDHGGPSGFQESLIEYDDLENENALEESISRLVLDDYDDDEDEERRQKLQRLGKRNNLSTYFMPPQVCLRPITVHFFPILGI